MDEKLRKYLIYLLKNNKIYYINKIGEYEEYSDKQRLELEISDIYKKILDLRHLNNIENGHLDKNTRPKVNYSFFIDQYKIYLEQLKTVKTIEINENSSLNDISNEISKIGFENYEDLKLHELKMIRKSTIQQEHEYIKNNSKK